MNCIKNKTYFCYMAHDGAQRQGSPEEEPYGFNMKMKL